MFLRSARGDTAFKKIFIWWHNPFNSHGPPTENDDAGGEEHEDGGDAEGEGVAGVVAKALHILQPRMVFTSSSTKSSYWLDKLSACRKQAFLLVNPVSHSTNKDLSLFWNTKFKLGNQALHGRQARFPIGQPSIYVLQPRFSIGHSSSALSCSDF